MLSSRLTRMISDHWEEIADRVLLRVTRDAKVLEFGKVPEHELRARAREIVQNMGNWMVSPEADLARRYEQMGRQRCEEGIPLHEMVYALHLLKECMIQYVRDAGLRQTPIELYAEEELQRGADHIFNTLVYYFVRGYERAMRQRAAHAA
jgi:hypothetical protein